MSVQHSQASAIAKKKGTPVSSTRNKANVLWIFCGIVAALGVFWLPWHIHATTPVSGESFAFGFNNRVAILAFAAAILIACLARYLSAHRFCAQKWLVTQPRLFPSWKEAKTEYLVLTAGCLLWSVAALLWGNYICDPAWCDSRGFYYGMDLLASGRVPYRDFMYNYGPATLYCPFWLSNITGGWLSFDQSYPITVGLFTSLGFIFIFLILRNLELPETLRPWGLGFCIFIWPALHMGLQGTSLRFLVVPGTLILFDAVFRKCSEKGGGSWLWIGAASVAAVTCSIMISPEMGICSVTAVAAFGFVLLLRRSFAQAVACLLGVALAAVASLLLMPDYLLTVFAFASGAENFPVYPNLHNVSLVAASLLSLPALIVAALCDPRQSRAPLTLSLAVAAGMLLPAAFGRCDPGHVASDGFIPIVLMFPAAAALGKTWLRGWIGYYIAVYVVGLQIFNWNLFAPSYSDAIQLHAYYRKNPQLIDSWRKEWDALRSKSPCAKNLHWSKVLPFPQELTPYTSKGTVGLTIGNEGNLWMARFLLLQNKLPRDYFHAYSQGAATKEQIAVKIRENSAYDFLIMPKTTFEVARGTIDLAVYQKVRCAYLSKILLFPMNSPVLHAPYLPEIEYARSMLIDYEPVADFNDYIILKKRSLSLIPQPQS